MPSTIFHIYVILFNFINGIVSGSTILLLTLQPYRDRKSRSYLYVELLLFLYFIATVVLNFFLLLQWEVLPTYDVIAICTLGLAFMYFCFCLEATNSWNRKHRWLARLLIGDVLLGIGLILTGLFSAYVGIDAQGYLVVSMHPTTILLVVAPICLFIFYASFLLLWNTYQGRVSISHKVVLGMICMAMALMFGVSTPFFRIIGGPLITIGLLLLVRPTLQQGVFDPLSRLNQQLLRRTEQLQAITRVGHVANSQLKVDALTATVLAEVKRSLAYTDAQIFLISDISETTPMPAVVQVAVRTNQVVRINAVDPELAMPFTIAGTKIPDRELIGIFYLHSQSPEVFDDDTVEVIQILANQIAIAFHNARLFEETQAANEAKTQFIGYISHEIRNPISSIVTMAQTIIEHGYMYRQPLPKEYLTDLMRIRRQSEHIKNLIDDLLDMSRIEANALKLSLAALDPLPILSEVQQTMTASLQPGVSFQRKYPEKLPAVWADATRLNQILMNLVSNAVKFTEHGTISLVAEIEGQNLRFEVTDTGQGISDNVLSRLFQPYTQDARESQQPRRGTGLGLAISKRLVELHGGTIQVVSKLGEGTTVSFTVPLVGVSVID